MHPKPRIAVMIAILTLVFWCLETLVRLIMLIVESKKNFVISAFYMDMEPLVKAHNFFALDVDDIQISINDEYREPLKIEAEKMKQTKKEKKKEKKIEKNKARIKEIKEKIFHR